MNALPKSHQNFKDSLNSTFMTGQGFLHFLC